MIELSGEQRWGPPDPFVGIRYIWKKTGGLGEPVILQFWEADHEILAQVGHGPDDQGYWLEIYSELIDEKKLWLLQFCVFCAVIFVVSEDFKSEVGPDFADYRWNTQ